MTQLCSIADLIAHHKGYYFTKDTMEFFKSKVYDVFVKIDENTYRFITSEKGPLTTSKRLYSIREYKIDTDSITTLGNFQGYTSLAQARKHIKQ